LKTILFHNIKGGVGKTTTSLNAAKFFAIDGVQVLIVDYDPQGNVTEMFFEDELLDNIVSPMPMIMTNPGSILDSIIKVEENLCLIPSSPEFVAADRTLDMMSMNGTPTVNCLKTALAIASPYFDICVIDSGPFMNKLAANAMMACDLLVVPVKPDRFARRGCYSTLASFAEFRGKRALGENWRVLFTMVSRTAEERNIIENMKEALAGGCFNSQIRFQPAPIITASSAREYAITRKKTAVAEDYGSFLQELKQLLAQ
jgi:chromosome partitioning protein